MANTYVKIATTTLTATASSISFTNIVGTYNDLAIKGVGRSNRADADDHILVEFNNDTGSGYGSRNMYVAIGSGSVGTEYDSDDIYGGFVTATNGTSNYWGYVDIYIPRYSTSVYQKAYMDNSGNSYAAKTSYAGIVQGLYTSTSPITTVTLKPFFGTLFEVGTIFTLYGIKNS